MMRGRDKSREYEPGGTTVPIFGPRLWRELHIPTEIIDRTIFKLFVEKMKGFHYLD